MRAWLTLVILCALTCTGQASASEEKATDGHIFDSRVFDRCVVHGAEWDDDGRLVAVSLRCDYPRVRYTKRRVVGDRDATWPTQEWADVWLGERVTCAVERTYTSNQSFYFSDRPMKICVRENGLE